MAQLPNGPLPLSGNERSDPAPASTPIDLLRAGRLSSPLRERLHNGRDHVAFEFLVAETRLDVLNDTIKLIADQEIASFLVDQIFQAASLLSSEAFSGIDGSRQELRSIGLETQHADPEDARRLYDRKVETLGQYVFALNRRVHQLESFMASCPLTGSGDNVRGIYGQRVRDLAGDVSFIRQELTRWVRKFVPLQKDLPQGGDSREFLEGRIDAVVDELGLRMGAIQETLMSTLFEQLLIFDPTLTRQTFFRRHIENVVDMENLVNWLSDLLDEVQSFDSSREPEQLEAIKAGLRDFDPEEFPALVGVRESDQDLFIRFVEEMKRYDPEALGGPKDDPAKVFILLIGDIVGSLRQRRNSFL